MHLASLEEAFFEPLTTIFLAVFLFIWLPFLQVAWVVFRPR